MTTREEFCQFLDAHGYIEDEYGYFVHPLFPGDELLTVYMNHFTRGTRINQTDEVIEYSKHTFDELDLIIFLSTDWDVAYYIDVEYHVGCILQLQTMFQDDFNNITEKNIAMYKMHQQRIHDHADYSAKCIREGKFNV